MSQLDIEALKAAQDTLIELWHINLSSLGVSQVYRFCNDMFANGDLVNFQGRMYEPVPMEASGFSSNLTGGMERPRIRLGNLDSTMTLLSLQHQDFIGATLIRLRTYAKYLNNGDINSPEYPRARYIITRKLEENQEFIEFECGSPIDIENAQIPGRVITRKCMWQYRGAECGYTGMNFYNKFNDPVMYLFQDECSKTVEGCKKRFGEHSELRYGGFPNADIQ